jgi:hypothetical protein
VDIDFLIFLHDRLPEDEIQDICTVNNIDFKEFKEFKEELEYTALPFNDSDTGEFD